MADIVTVRALDGKTISAIHIPIEEYNDQKWRPEFLHAAIDNAEIKPTDLNTLCRNLYEEAPEIGGVNRTYDFGNGKTLTFQGVVSQGTVHSNIIDYHLMEWAISSDPYRANGYFVADTMQWDGVTQPKTDDKYYMFFADYNNNNGVVHKQANGAWALYPINPGTLTFTNIVLDIFTDPNIPHAQSWPGTESDKDPTGGDGNFDDLSEVIPDPEIATITPFKSNLINMYHLTTAQLTMFSNFLWSENFITNFKKLMTDPIEAVMGLYCAFFNMPTIPDKTIHVGTVDSEVPALGVDEQYHILDMGTLDIEPYWGSALDFSPYTTMQIYLPFIGMKSISPDDVVGGRMNVKYYVDLLTGSAVCHIRVMNKNLDAILYSFPCNLYSQIPVTGKDMREVTLGLINGAYNMANSLADIGLNKAATSTKQDLAVAGLRSVLDTTQTLLNAKTPVQRTGALSTAFGALSPRKPYLVINRPIQSLPKDYKKFRGYPCNQTYKLSELAGYTVVGAVNISGILATEAEKDEIERLLKSGVIL